MLVVGIAVAILAVPSLFAAYLEDRAPRAGAIAVLVAGVLVVTAVQQRPGGYTPAQVPDAFWRVVGRVMR